MNETVRIGSDGQFIRFSAGTCNAKPYKSFMDGIWLKFKMLFFYVNVLQFALVTLMYVNVGKGRYWKILFYAAAAACLGCIIENSTVSFICREDVKNRDFQNVYTFFIAEFCWVINEYAIPFLNLTKMKAFSKGKTAKFVNFVIIGLFPVFVAFRFYIGYNRMKYGLLTTSHTKYGHSFAFAVMAVADIICTIAILYFVRKHNSQEAVKTTNITNYVKRSSYVILLCVDIIGVLLAITNSLTEKFHSIPGSLVNPFHCIKCSFILILASDALLFKYSVNTSSVHGSSGNYYNRYTKSRNNYIDSNSNNNMSLKNKSQSNTLTNITNITPYNYPTLDFNKNEPSIPYQSKSIVKNYTNIKIPPSFYENSPDSDLTYSSPSFGFLYQKE